MRTTYCSVIAEVQAKRPKFYYYRIHVGLSKYAVPFIQTFMEEDLELPAEALLPLEHKDKFWFVRLFYGRSYTTKIRIDALRFDLTRPKGEVERKAFSAQELDAEAWSELSDRLR